MLLTTGAGFGVLGQQAANYRFPERHTILKAKKEELRKLEEKMLKTKEESAALSSTNEKLRQERSSLKAALLEERRHVVTDVKAINTTARSTIAELKEDLGIGVRDSITEVNKLRNQALRLGKELGQFNEMIESSKWLKGLQALIKGDEEVEPCKSPKVASVQLLHNKKMICVIVRVKHVVSYYLPQGYPVLALAILNTLRILYQNERLRSWP